MPPFLIFLFLPILHPFYFSPSIFFLSVLRMCVCVFVCAVYATCVHIHMCVNGKFVNYYLLFTFRAEGTT